MAVERKPWQQREGEPDLWYDRFEVFRMLGAFRSVRKTYQAFQREDPEMYTGKTTPPGWHEKAKQWGWAERARAYDLEQREQFMVQEQEIAMDRRMRRLQIIQELEGDTFAALKTANIAEMDEEKARAFFPQLRMLLLGLLAHERVELGGPATEDSQQQSELSDELLSNIAKNFGQKGHAATGERSSSPGVH